MSSDNVDLPVGVLLEYKPFLICPDDHLKLLYGEDQLEMASCYSVLHVGGG